MVDLRKDEEDNPFERAAEFHQRLSLSTELYPQVVELAIDHALLPGRGAPPVPDQPWVCIGPRNIGGRIMALAQDPVNPLTLFAGSAQGGLWRTTDGGDTWEHLGGPEHNFPVGAIAVAHPGPQAAFASTLYVGTGTPEPGHASGRGLYKVTFAGPRSPAVFARLDDATKPVSPPANATHGRALRYPRIQVDPEDPDRFWAASQTGLWRCHAPSKTWVKEFPPSPPGSFPVPSGGPAPPPGIGWPSYATDLRVARDPRDTATTTVGSRSVARYLVLYLAIAGHGVFRARYDRQASQANPVEGWTKLDVPGEVITLRITTGGVTGTAQFTYQVDGGAPSAPRITSTERFSIPDSVKGVAFSPPPVRYDAGNTWTAGTLSYDRGEGHTSTGDPIVFHMVGRIGLAICERHPRHVYAVMEHAEKGQATAVYRSTNNGESWRQCGRIPRAFKYLDKGQAGYDLVLEVNPDNPEVLLCGEIDLCKSEDGGAHWTPILQWQNYYAGDYAQHADQHAALFDAADRRRVWAGNDGGLSMARDLRRFPGSPKFWRKRSHGIVAGQLQDVTVHPDPALSFLSGGGLQDSGTFLSFGGPTWYQIGGGDGGMMAVSALNPRHFLTTVQYDAPRRSQVGTGSNYVNPVVHDLSVPDPSMKVGLFPYSMPPMPATSKLKGPFVGLLQQNPLVPGQILIGWTADPPVAVAYWAPSPGIVNAITIQPAATAPGRGEQTSALTFGPDLGTGTIDGWIGTTGGQIFFSDNSPSGNWRPVATPLPSAGDVRRQVTRIAVHPNDPRIVAVASIQDIRTVQVSITTPGPKASAKFKYRFVFHDPDEELGPLSPEQPTANPFLIPGTLLTVTFGAGPFAANDTWMVRPDGSVDPTPPPPTPSPLTAAASPGELGGQVHLSYDRGRSWIPITQPAAPLPRPSPDPKALPPGPVASLEIDRSDPSVLFAGTLAGIYVLRGIPSPTGLAVTPSPPAAPLPVGQKLQLTARLTLSGIGAPLDCTTEVDWSSSSPAVATVGSAPADAGQVTGVAAGTAIITARRGRGALVATVQVTVAAAGPALPAPAALAPMVAPPVTVDWRPFSGPPGYQLPLTLVTDIETVPGTRILRAATFGRGVWECDLAGGPQHQLFIRQTVIEDGRTYPRVIPANLNDDPRLAAGTVGLDFTHAFDIRVDAAPIAFFDDRLDGVEFDEELGADELVPLRRNAVYVQVHNRGWDPVVNAVVHLYFLATPTVAPAGVPPTVPVPGGLTATSNVYNPPSFDPTPVPNAWQRVGPAQTIPRVGPAEPVVVRFDWDPPAALAGASVALLALSTTDTANPNSHDRLPTPLPAGRATIAQLVTQERRAALRIVPVATLAPATLSVRDGVDDDTRNGSVAFAGRSPDIIVVQNAVADLPGTFRDLLELRPQDQVKAGANHVYVRVQNRGVQAANAEVHVWAVALDATHTPSFAPATWTRLTPAAGTPPVPQPVPAGGAAFVTVPVWNAVDPNPGDDYKAYAIVALVRNVDAGEALPNTASITSLETFWTFFGNLLDSHRAALRVLRFKP
jgi:hypothetical protein